MSNDITAITTNSAEVRIWVDDDDDANRVSAVLEALGYTVLRELAEGEGPTRLRRAISRMSWRHKLTEREQDILELVLAGRLNHEIAAQLEISRATVKWHMHNIFAKTNTSAREGLLRLALQISGARPSVEVPSQPPRMVGLASDPPVIPAEAVPSKPWL